MRLSHGNLNKLKSSEYNEFKSLRKKDFDGEIPAWAVGILFHILFSIIVAFKVKNNNWVDSLILFFIFLLFPYCWIPAYIVGGIVSGVYSFFAHKSTQYPRFEELRRKLSPVEKDVRQDLNNYLDYNLRNLITRLRHNSLNPILYPNLIADLQANHIFIEEASELLDAKSLKTKYDKILEKENVIFINNLPKIGEKPTETNRKTNWWKKYRDVGSPISLKIETDEPIKAHPHKPTQNPKPHTSKPKSSEPKIKKNELPKSDTVKSLRQSSLFDAEEDSYATSRRRPSGRTSRPTKKAVTPKPEPPKMKTPRQGRVFQPSADYYRKVADRRMEIGRRGELFVMEHEKNRLIAEDGADFLSKLEHSSLVRGDGLGYDILSIDNEAEIYIEVKTTTGKFSSGIFFTENEFNTMSRYEGRYYLYRVYEFDEVNNTGQILIFKGREMIESYFDFSPKVYVLTQKKE